MINLLYAHYDKASKIGQPLPEHLEAVAGKMVENISTLKFECSLNEHLRQLLSQTGYYHDVGKIMESFQRYLKTDKGGHEKDHALISAAMFQTKYDAREIDAYLAMLAIAKHHGDLTCDVETNNILFSQLTAQYKDIWQQVQSNLEFTALLDVPFDLEEYEVKIKRTASKIRQNKYEKYGVEPFFLLQYIFSKLIWADKLNSAGLAQQERVNTTKLADIERYIQEKNQQVMAVNEKRETIRRSVLEKVESLSDDEFDKTRIFQLTAPTGTGKTLTSICAGLKIMERMQKLYQCRGQIITALPFINILEQTKIDYEAFFADVLVRYSGADLYDTTDNKAECETGLQKKLLLMSAWESPVVITTFVQFFESILTDKNSQLIKLHKLAGSVVILDEVQAIPFEYAPLLGAVIQHLADFYGTRFILMTATQPEIVTMANRFLPKENPMHTYELLPTYQKYYADLKRTKLVTAFDKVQDNEQLVEFIKATKAENQSALVVVNTIHQSIEVYHMLKEEYKVLYLSTNLIPVDRKAVIKAAKDLLKRKIPFVLVSTQTIEAGVDLDFDIGYRDLAPLASIIQVAGRINRAGDKGKYLSLYVFDTGSGKYVYDQYPRQETRKMLKERESIGEDEYLSLIKQYYQRIAKSEQHERQIYQAMHTLKYKTDDKDCLAIRDFSLIEKQDNIKTVLITKTVEVQEKAEEYAQLLEAGHLDFAQKAKLKQLLAELSRYTVDVRVTNLAKNIPCKFADVHRVNLNWYVVQLDEVKNYYNETGFMTESPNAFVY